MDSERIETKYIVNNCLFVKDLLLSNFLIDSEYFFNYVFTIHFDTYELNNYYDKLNGSFYKSKLRIRWYSDTDRYFLPGKIYVENKVKKNNLVLKYRRETFLTEKQRKEILNPIYWTEFVEKFKPHLQIRCKKPMLPVMISCYRRYRFEDPFSGNRISLDDSIQALQVSPLIPRSKNISTFLKGGVLETKGKTYRLPLSLKSAGIFKIASFSKYERLLTKHIGD